MRAIAFTECCTILQAAERRFSYLIAKMADDKKQTNISQSGTTSVTIKGEYKRKESAFRNKITADGSSGFKAEKDRYHLYVSLACPFAHRTLITRKLKGLEEVFPYTVVDWLLGENGWSFTDQKPKCTLDPVNGAKYLREIYYKADPNYDGKFSVPVVWDKKTNTIVNNESAEIIRMLNSEFNEFCATPAQRELDLYPEALRSEIDELNSWIYPKINNGVYRAGFATSQEAYDEGVKDVFEGIDKVEEILNKKRYLTGNSITEADIRLLTSLLRFDTVYHGHFKCNKKRIIDCPNIWGYVRDLYAIDGISETVDQEHIQKCYQLSQRGINPHGIVAIGPDIDFNAPHNRDKLFK